MARSFLYPLLAIAFATQANCAHNPVVQGTTPTEITKCSSTENTGWTIQSPDQRITFNLSQSSSGQLYYDVSLEDIGPVLGCSPIGLVVSRANAFEGPDPVRADFSDSVTVVASHVSEHSDTYTLKHGKRRQNLVLANSVTYEIRDDETGQRLDLEVRVLDGGFGFRYLLPETDPLFSRVLSEATSFNIGKGAKFWGQPYDFPSDFQPAYETPFVDGIPSGTPATGIGTGWSFPSLFETSKGSWVLLHEANLTASYHGSHLDADPIDGIYRIAPPLASSAQGFGTTEAASTRPWVMPWRIGILGDDLGDILESNMVFDFADASKVEDASWIHPGVASWSWVSDHTSSRDFSKLSNFIDLSAEMGWSYSLIDANWNTISDHAMKDLVAYADEQSVGLFFWYNSGGRHNSVSEQPRNIMNDQKLRREEFQKLQRAGAKGVKVDFFQSDKQDIIKLYLDILKDAADFELMVNFHGSTIPRGWERTWPNLMTMEAVRGAEAYSFPSEPDYGALAPWHNTILPFTRNVIGPMDYTPVLYTDLLIERRTTIAHETALAVVFESGVQHIADSAQSLRNLPEAFKDFFRQLPVAWDETRYLDGYPGDYVVIARRSGDKWYVAGINGTNQAKQVSLDLTYLSLPDYPELFIHDGPTGGEFESSDLHIKAANDVSLEMRPYGGFVIVL